VPVLAFVHWGREFVTEPAAREEMLAQEMRRRGVAAIVGAHPHQASADVTEIGGGDVSMIYSLGNFLFDQDGDTASGALAEVTAFDQGTLFLRQVPLPNLYDAALGRGQQDEPKPGSR
jgi:poly-gamma-glutamate synthesis protein (capsule biosynthesis protein)